MEHELNDDIIMDHTELTERRILNKANSLILDLLEEQYFIVFVKAYNWKNGLNQLKLWDYFLLKVKNSEKFIS